jgi:anhydro-N-acetylmuramic acid kinase
MRVLIERLLAGEALVAGVMSGTSADGIDVALTRFEPALNGRLGRVRPLTFRTFPFQAGLARRVRRVLDGEPTDLRACAPLSRDLGRAFGRAARELAEAEGLELELVGSHGQTVWHHDGVGEPASLQLGDGDFVGEAARCACVSDFRQRDIACGGEGAPIAALADDLLFADLPRPAAVLNLGGISNLTILPAPGAELASFDTGPAGALLDGLARRLLGRPFDRGGERAVSGAADPRLLAELLRHPFLERAPPKSTGRDTFGEAWVDQVVERAGALGVLEPDDLLATAADFVARCVSDALARHAPWNLKWLLACGGGTHHARVLDSLASSSPVPLARGDDFGVPADAREALAFAVLAARCILGEPVTSPSATGAAPGRTLGKISPAAIEPSAP